MEVKTTWIAVIGLVLCCMLSSAYAEKIKTESDKSTNFSAYRTYAWGRNLEPQRRAAGIAVLGAVNDELKKKGLQETDINHADLIVRYEAAGDTDLNVGVTDDPTYSQIGGTPALGATPWTSGVGASSSGRYIRKGSLVVDIFDRQQRKLVWTGHATGALNNSPNKAIEQINKIVTKMFDHYPESK